jgi:hypothetical protein
MKNDKFTVTHQNMTQQEMSVRDADHENDLFREAFEAAIKDENLSAEQQFFALDFFIGGWEAAVRLLNDDTERATAGNAAPTEAEAGEGGASALRAEPASQHDAQRAAIIDALSQHRMVRMDEVEEDGSLGNSYPLLDRLCLDDGRDVESGRAEVEAIADAVLDALDDLASATRCRADGGVTSNSASSELASNTATTAPGDLLPVGTLAWALIAPNGNIRAWSYSRANVDKVHSIAPGCTVVPIIGARPVDRAPSTSPVGAKEKE